MQHTSKTPSYFYWGTLSLKLLSVISKSLSSVTCAKPQNSANLVIISLCNCSSYHRILQKHVSHTWQLPTVLTPSSDPQTEPVSAVSPPFQSCYHPKASYRCLELPAKQRNTQLTERHSLSYAFYLYSIKPITAFHICHKQEKRCL